MSLLYLHSAVLADISTVFEVMTSQKKLNEGKMHVHPIKLTLEEIFHGCLKKVTFQRRKLLPDGHVETEDRHLVIDVKSGLPDGTRFVFEGCGYLFDSSCQANIAASRAPMTTCTIPAATQGAVAVAWDAAFSKKVIAGCIQISIVVAHEQRRPLFGLRRSMQADVCVRFPIMAAGKGTLCLGSHRVLWSLYSRSSHMNASYGRDKTCYIKQQFRWRMPYKALQSMSSFSMVVSQLCPLTRSSLLGTR